MFTNLTKLKTGILVNIDKNFMATWHEVTCKYVQLTTMNNTGQL